MLDLTFKTVGSKFFYPEKVADPLERAKQKRLSQFGAFVRQRARSSIRKRKRVSEPGSPPSSHAGTYRDSIFFAKDGTGQSVVIGPIRLNKGDGEAPALLEQGGDVVRLDRRKKPHKRHYRARPHMQPAFAAELEKEPQRWAGMVKAKG